MTKKMSKKRKGEIALLISRCGLMLMLEDKEVSAIDKSKVVEIAEDIAKDAGDNAVIIKTLKDNGVSIKEFAEFFIDEISVITALAKK
jgi:hypothetical protein